MRSEAKQRAKEMMNIEAREETEQETKEGVDQQAR